MFGCIRCIPDQDGIASTDIEVLMAPGVHMRWTIPPANPLTSIPSSLVVTNGNLQAVRQVGPQEFELDVLGTGSSVTVTMPANQAGVYAHEERSLEMAGFGPVELIFNIILERASLGFHSHGHCAAQ